MASAGRILIMPKGRWAAETTYENLDMVAHSGRAWLAKKVSVGIEPSDANAEFWHDFLGMDVFTEANPPTASDVGAIPNPSGLLDTSVIVGGGVTYAGFIANASGDERQTVLQLITSPEDISNIVRVGVRSADGSSENYYRLYGEHNKPKGTYTGNGSPAHRSISIGGIATVDGAVFIRGGAYNAIVGGAGGFWWDTSGNHGAIPASEAMFETGMLYLNTANSAVNGNGLGHMYNVLV